MSQSKYQRTLRKCHREMFREASEPMIQRMALQDRPNDVRLSLMRAAYERYDGVPDDVLQLYHPDAPTVVLLKLPDL